MNKPVLKTKETNAREWIESLSNDEPGEWWMEQIDMDLIKEALALWLSRQETYKPAVQVVVDGITYETVAK